jgi:hypothetical protein
MRALIRSRVFTKKRKIALNMYIAYPMPLPWRDSDVEVPSKPASEYKPQSKEQALSKTMSM